MIYETLRSARSAAQSRAERTERAVVIVGGDGEYRLCDIYTARRDYRWDIVEIIEP